MRLAKSVSFAAALGLIAALGLLAFGLNAPSGRAAGQERPELVPGLDLWLHERGAAPYWETKPATPDLLPRAERHREFLQAGVPLEYRGRTSPYPAIAQAINDGGRLYGSHCAACHGAQGFGDGRAGEDLTPSPALLAYMIVQPRSVDEYLLWTISEGGVPFGSEMPAFRNILTEQQIWQIVNYMRAGFPQLGTAE